MLTWEIAQLPSGKCLVRCRWVYTIKYKAYGFVERFKAQLVAKGYTQTYGIDYEETFAPLAKLPIVKILVGLAALYGWTLRQYDVKNVFLYGDLEEEIYMTVPLRYDAKFPKNVVCRL